jgi:hypothetical protein
MRRRIAFGALTLIFAGAAALALFWPKPALANSPCNENWGPPCSSVCTRDVCDEVCGDHWNCVGYEASCISGESWCRYSCISGPTWYQQCTGACHECDGGGEPGGSPVFVRKPTPK